MSNKKKTKLTFVPTLNGQELGDDWIVANGMKASRPMTPEEQDALTNGYVKFLAKSGREATVTKNGNKTTIIVKG